MPKQLNVALNFTANTTQAKQSVTELSNLLTKIAYGTNINVSATGINEASTAAKELAFHLNKAYDATTGNFDLSKLNTSLKQAGTNITQLSTKLLTAGETGQQAFVKLAQSISQANAPIMKTNGLLTQMWTTMQNTLRWQISSSILHGFMGAIQKASGYAKDLNQSLNNIRIVTGNSTEQMAKFAEQANKAAKALNTTTTTYTDAALIYYQQGLSDKEVQARTDVTVKMANVAGESADTIASEMTAVWNNFNKAGDQAEEHFADVMTKLGAETASSTKEIATGLEKFAAIADTVGLSFDYAAAALATVTATTRESADVVGTAFKTIFGRLEGLKLGETLDDGTDLNKYSQALLSVGVNIKDTSGELKDMDTILDELGERWKTLSKDQQVALAETVGGMRQYNQMMALMGNWDFFKENLGRAQSSDGTLQAQADIYAESWEAARKKVKASMESLYSDLLDDKFFIKLNTGLAQVIDGIDDFIDHIGGLKSLLIGIGALVLSTVSNKIQPALQQTIQNIQVMMGGARKAYTQLSRETQTNINNQLVSGNYSTADQQALINSSQLMEAKTRLTMVSKQLTEQEKAEYDMALQGIEIQQQRIQSLANEATALETTGDKLVAEMHDYDTLGGAARVFDETITDLTFDYNKLQWAFDSGDLTVNQTQLDAAQDSLLGYRTAADEVKSALADAGDEMRRIIDDQNNVNNATKQFTDDTSRAIVILNPFKNLLNEWSHDLSTGAVGFEDLQRRMGLLEESILGLIPDNQQLRDAFEELRNASDASDWGAKLPNLKIALQSVGLSAKQVEQIFKNLYPENKLGEQFINNSRQAAKALKELSVESSVVKAALADFVPTHTVTALEALTQSAAAFGSAAMLINSIKNAINTLTDDDATTLEKISALFMGFSMAVPSVMSLVKTVTMFTAAKKASTAVIGEEIVALISSNAVEDAATTKKLAEIGANKLLTAARLTNIKASEKQAIVDAITAASSGSVTLAEALESAAINEDTKKTLLNAAAKKTGAAANAAFIASMGPYIAIAAAVLAAIIAIVKAIKKHREEEEALTQAIVKSNETSAEAFNKTADALKNLSSSFDNYQSLVDKLDKCKQGSIEWYDTLLEIQGVLNELQNNAEFQQLSKLYSEENGGTSPWVFNDQGIRVLSQDYLDWEANYNNTRSHLANANKYEGDKRADATSRASSPSDLLSGYYDAFTGESGQDLQLATAGLLNSNLLNFDSLLLNAGVNSTDSTAYVAKSLADWANPLIAGQYDNVTDYINQLLSDDNFKQGLLDHNNITAETAKNYPLFYTVDDSGNIGFTDEYLQNFTNFTARALTDLNENSNYVSAANKATNTGFLNPVDEYTVTDRYATTAGELINQFAAGVIKDGTGTLLGVNDVIANNDEIYNQVADAYATNVAKAGTESLANLWDTYVKYNPTLASAVDVSYDDENGVVHYKETEDGEEKTIAKVDLANTAGYIETANNSGNLAKKVAAAVVESTDKINNAPKTVGPIDVDQMRKDQEEIQKFTKNLEKNGVISSENYDKLIGVNKDLDQFFTITNDGTYQLVTDADAFRQAVDNIDISKIQTNLDVFNRTNDAMSKNNLPGLAEVWQIDQLGLLNAWQNNGYNNGQSETDIEQRIGQKTLINGVLGEGTWESANEDLETLNELLQQAITEYLSLSEEQDKLSSALSTYADSAHELTQLGVLEDTKAYGEGLIRLGSNYDECTKEVRDYQQALAKNNGDIKKCTTEQRALAKAVKDAEWRKATADVKKFVDELANKKSKKEIQEQYDGIAQAFSDAFDINVTSDWVEENIELIKKWRNSTGQEAQSLAVQLQALASIDDTESINIPLDIDKDHKIDGFMTNIETLKGILEANPITVDANGNADFTALIAALVEAGVTAEGLATILAQIGATDLSFDVDGTPINYDPSDPASLLEALNKWNADTVVKGYAPPVDSVDMTKITPSGNGGGGSNKPKKKDIERYHEDIAKLDDLTKAYEKASRAKDKLYGTRRVAAIDDEIKATDALIKQQEAYIKHIEAYTKDDKDLAAMQKAINAYLPGTVADAKDGIITNWTDIMNAAAEKYKNDTSEDADENWEEFEKAIKQYEDTFNLLQEQQAQLEEYILQRQELVLEQLNEKLQIKIQIDENDLKMIEIVAERMASNFAKYGEMIGKMSETYGTYNDKYSAYETYVDDLNKKLQDNEINSAQYVEAMQGAYDNLLDAAKDLMAYDEKMLDYYGQALDDAFAKLDPYLNQLEHINSVFEHYSNILDLTSKKDADYYKKKKTLLQGVVTNAENEYKVAKEYYNTIIAQKTATEKLWDTVKNNPNAPNYDEIKKQWDAVCEAEQEAHERMLEDAETWVESINSLYETMVDNLIDEWDRAMSDGFGLDTLLDQMSNLSTYQEEWLTNTNKIYEMNKLLRKVTSEMDKTNNVAAKQRLANYAKELEQKRESGEMTQLELEIEQAKYEQLLAQIALEEAQNAKSKVMLSQDSEGNFGYVYTADQDSINEAEQNLEDANNNLYNIALKGSRENGEKLAKEEQRHLNAMAEITKRRDIEETEREKLYQQEEELHEKLRETYLRNFTTSVTLLTDETAQALGWTVDAMDRSYWDLINTTQLTKDEIVKYTQGIIDITDEWGQKVNSTSTTLKTDLGDVETETKNLTNDSNALYKEVKNNLIPTLQTGLTGALSKVSEYISTQRTEVQGLIDKYIDLGDKAKKALELEATKAPEEKKTEPPKTDTTKPDTPKTENKKDGNAVIAELKTAIAGGARTAMAQELIELTYANATWKKAYEGKGGDYYGLIRAYLESQGYAFASGGYTGEWGPEGKLAVLHQKELVLNAEDTENILKSVDIIHKIASALDLNMLWNKASMAHLSASGVGDNNRTLEQTVTITAEFPNAHDRNEIEAAFGDLLNRASQYANR